MGGDLMAGYFGLEGAREMGSQSGLRRQGGASFTRRGSSLVGQPKGEPAVLGRLVAAALWPSGRRRKTKGLG
jgi:hypothetical protein